MTFELVDREDAHGVICGSNYGASIRIMARSPTHVLFNALGCHIWTRGTDHWHGLKRVFQDRPVRAKFEAAKPKIDEVFGEGAGDAVVEAWRVQKTVLFDGGGDPLPLPNHVRRYHNKAAFEKVDPTWHADLHGRTKTCLQCGKDLRPETAYHHLTKYPKDDHPKSIADCQRLTNQEVIAIHGHAINYKHLWGVIAWFETWDGERYMDPFFCNSTCTAKYGRRAAEAGVVLEAGVEPEKVSQVGPEGKHHYDEADEQERSSQSLKVTMDRIKL